MKYTLRLIGFAIVAAYILLNVLVPRTTEPIHGTVNFRYTENGFLGTTNHIILIRTKTAQPVALVIPMEEFYIVNKGQGITYYAHVDWITGIPIQWHIIYNIKLQSRVHDG